MTVLTKDEEYKLDHIFILQLRQYLMSCHCLVSSAAQLQEITYWEESIGKNAIKKFTEKMKQSISAFFNSAPFNYNTCR